MTSRRLSSCCCCVVALLRCCYKPHACSSLRMASQASPEHLKYGRLSMKALRKFVPVASQQYNFPHSPFCKRMFTSMTTMNPFFFLASLFLRGNNPSPLKSRDAKVARSLEMLTVAASPLVPVLESILAGFPFDGALDIDPTTRGVGAKGEGGLELFESASRLTEALYESFFRGLLGPITSADQFVPDVLARPNISGPGPIFIVGVPRTGTSLLQFLLSLDKKHNRSPTMWEFRTPASIRPQEERIQAGTPSSSLKGYSRWREIQAEHPAEDIELFRLAGYIRLRSNDDNQQDWVNWNMNKRDHVAMLCLHRLIIRLLECQEQHHGQDSSMQWIFKDPVHLSNHMEAIIKVYPNARFIWMHRNLNDVVNSNFRISPELAPNPRSAAFYVAALLATQHQGMAFRQTGQYLEDGDFHAGGAKHKTYNKNMPPESQEHRFYDVFLEDLHKDPVGELRKLYEMWNMPFTEEYKVAISNWNTSKDKRDAIVSNTTDLSGLEDLQKLTSLLMRNRDYLNT
jgi:Sulfotransferase family